MHFDPQQTASPETMHFDPQDWGSKTASASSTSVISLLHSVMKDAIFSEVLTMHTQLALSLSLVCVCVCVCV